RRGNCAHTISAMTNRAGARKKRFPASRVAGQRIDHPNALSLDARSGGNAAREKRNVRDDVTHVGARDIEHPAIEAALETVVDTIFDQIDARGSSAKLRKTRVNADEGN